MKLNNKTNIVDFPVIHGDDFKSHQLPLKLIFQMHAGKPPIGENNVSLLGSDQAGAGSVIILRKCLVIQGHISITAWRCRLMDIEAKSRLLKGNFIFRIVDIEID